ncbi:hypothetical protein BDV93DRAFT_510821 [Ceratobasidium sp. AG-I]|nr:hypothetical protein BDV93DRAFT_510821 [Ceratobasidium sp. AG-I]
MFTGIKRKAKQKAQDYANKIRRTSSPELAAEQSSSVPISNPGGTNTPVPTVTLSEPPSDATVPAPFGSSCQVAPSAAPQLVATAPVLVSADTPSATSQISRSTWPVVRNIEPAKGTSSASTAAPGAGRSAKSTTWSGLKTLLDLLNASADAFGPLKSAVGGILECINIYEREAKAREDYEKLGAELDLLFWDLFNCLNGSTPSPPTISSLLNLSK